MDRVGMPSSGRSKRSSLTPVAWRLKMAKFTPLARKVAPKGNGTPERTDWTSQRLRRRSNSASSSALGTFLRPVADSGGSSVSRETMGSDEVGSFGMENGYLLLSQKYNNPAQIAAICVSRSSRQTPGANDQWLHAVRCATIALKLQRLSTSYVHIVGRETAVEPFTRTVTISCGLMLNANPWGSVTASCRRLASMALQSHADWMLTSGVVTSTLPGCPLTFRNRMIVSGQPGRVHVTTPLVNIRSAWLCNAMEANRRQLAVTDPHGFAFSIKPHEIVTVRVKGSTAVSRPTM